ncbi:MAG: hypothetical protein ACR2O2_15040 [Ruegeria sp.]
MTPEQTNLHGMPIRRMITGLWQMADQERDGRMFDLDAAAVALVNHAQNVELQAAAPGPSGDVYALERDANGVHGNLMKYDLNAEAAP